MHICGLVSEENFKSYSVHWEFCCFTALLCTQWKACTDWEFLKVTVGPVRSKKSDITLAYWWSCKDLVRGWSRLGDLVHLCSWRVQVGWDLRWLFQMEATINLHSSSLSRMHSSSMQWWSLCLYTRSQILETLRWASIALCCLISSCKWHQDRVATSCHWSTLATTDQIRQVSHYFCAHFWFFCIIFETKTKLCPCMLKMTRSEVFWKKDPTRKVWTLMICDQCSAFPT